MNIRPAGAQDSDQLLVWVNRPDCLAQKLLTAGPVPRDVHEAWMARRLADPDTRLFIIEEAGVPVGQARLQADDGAFKVDIYVVPEGRGRGLAHQGLSAAITALRREGRAEPIVAEVLPRNGPSQALFIRLGFVQTEADEARIVFVLSGDPMS